ncbi:unnamed protein product [Cyprideis torosa]|uniref:Uncharacterized protein n=1 Tax=Cyprideis torosa TaxID=163714 RepID=A0A7R8ZSX5_9CRUS|nr:unnamed protein product [Cyprideis torosa]CAG0896605.1 unnamed protein product [Cyprideis torosa]
MAETVAVASAPKAKKTTKPKVPAAHPKYSEMIVAAVKALKERNGSSRQAILKYIMANYKVGNDSKKVGVFLRKNLKKAVDSGMLKHSKGAGASGSFRVTDKAEKPKKVAARKPEAPKAKKPTPKAAGANKPKSPKAKKPKTTAAKKSPVKPKAAKPKVAKKPATAKPKAAKPARKPATAKPKVAKKPAAAKKPAVAKKVSKK